MTLPAEQVCIDWYWTVYVEDEYGNFLELISETYLYTTCNEPGGGGGEPIDSGEAEENSLDTDCESFTFVKTSSANWQEAGLNKISLRMVWTGQNGNLISVRFIDVDGLVFGIPTYYTNPVTGATTNVSTGRAANLAAAATEYTRNMTYTNFRDSPTYPQPAAIKSYFISKANEFMMIHAGTAGTRGSGSSNIIFRNEQRTHWFGNPLDC